MIEIYSRSTLSFRTKSVCSQDTELLHTAIECGWLGVAKSLLRRRVTLANGSRPQSILVHTVHHRGQKMVSLLHMAAARGFPEIVELLLDWGAEVDVLKGGMTALEIALKNAEEETARILLKHKADVALREQELHRTPMHLAAISGCTKVMLELLKQGARIDVVDRWG